MSGKMLSDEMLSGEVALMRAVYTDQGRGFGKRSDLHGSPVRTIRQTEMLERERYGCGPSYPSATTTSTVATGKRRAIALAYSGERKHASAVSKS